MRAILSAVVCSVVLCCYALAIAAQEIEPVTSDEPPAVANKKPKPDKPDKPVKPDRHDKHRHVDPVVPEPQPEPDVHPIPPVGPVPDPNFHPVNPRPQPKPDGKVIDNLIHNVPTPVTPGPLARLWGWFKLFLFLGVSACLALGLLIGYLIFRRQ